MKHRKRKTLRQIWGVKVWNEYCTLRNFAGMMIQREIVYERIKRIRPREGYSVCILCVDCGAVATAYDHRDYFEPTKVEPVCARCNIKRGPATKTLERLKAGEEFIDPRILYEPYPCSWKQEGNLT